MLKASHASPENVLYSVLLSESFKHWTGRSLIDYAETPEALAEAIYHAPFALVSHGTEADPIFRYANQTALRLWEMPWEEFTRMPSRLSAQAVDNIQDERQRLLKKAMQAGWVDDYRGIRISKSGKRFEIRKTILWNVIDAQGHRQGQAAMIPGGRFLG